MEQKKIISLEDRMPRVRKKRRKRMNRILVIYISIFFLLALGILYFQSSLSEVKEIEVIGADKLDKNVVLDWSGVHEGMNIWNVNQTDVKKNIKKQTNLIQSVQVERKIPSTIVITIQERKQIALLKTADGFQILLDNGKALTGLEGNIEDVDGPVLIDWQAGPYLDDLLRQLDLMPVSITKSISEIHPMDPEHISNQLVLFTTDGYEVRASIVDFADKMRLYPSIVATLDKKKKGYIDLSVGAFFKSYD